MLIAEMEAVGGARAMATLMIAGGYLAATATMLRLQ
jgi:hypothetical protein